MISTAILRQPQAEHLDLHHHPRSLTELTKFDLSVLGRRIGLWGDSPAAPGRSRPSSRNEVANAGLRPPQRCVVEEVLPNAPRGVTPLSRRHEVLDGASPG